MSIEHKRLWKWRPFTYLVEDFDGKIRNIDGVFPDDVRGHCDFTIKKIHGPVVVGFWSFVMRQVVGA